MTTKPSWFNIAQHLLIPVFKFAGQALDQANWNSMHPITCAKSALYHIRGCLNMVNIANAEGEHSVGAALIRQCVEAITLVEFGLQEESIGAPALNAWHENKKTNGQLRKMAEAQIWYRYEKGLWNESWEEFFGELSKVVQTYAHYSQRLMLWQFHFESSEPQQVREIAGRKLALHRTHLGPDPQDDEKVWQLALLQALIIWTVGRILVENHSPHTIKSDVDRLGKELAQSSILAKGQLNWSELLLPVSFPINSNANI